MAEKEKDKFLQDPLVLRSVYPDAGAIFSFKPESLHDVMPDCLVVLDTNVLLVPYSTGKESLEEIRRTYTALATQNRLVVPGQVAREFARNRSEKLKTLYQQLSRRRDFNFQRQSYPLLGEVPEYAEVVRLEEAIYSKLSEYRQAIGKLLDTVASWYWDDPVSTLYRELFSEKVVVDPEFSDDLLEDLKRRQANKIPPGYKDAGKSDEGVGDLIIWRTILSLAAKREKHLVFVSGDEKPDWWHNSEKQALFPRFELIDEFRRATNGKSVHIIKLAELLSISGASQEVVQEVKNEEAISNFDRRPEEWLFEAARAGEAEEAVVKWLRATSPPNWILTEEPELDAVLADPVGGRVGFFVTFLWDARDAADLRQEFFLADLRLKQSLFRHNLSRAYIVMVFERMVGIVELREQSSLIRPSSPLIGVIVGVMRPDGSFQEVFRLDPDINQGDS